MLLPPGGRAGGMTRGMNTGPCGPPRDCYTMCAHRPASLPWPCGGMGIRMRPLMARCALQRRHGCRHSRANKPHCYTRPEGQLHGLGNENRRPGIQRVSTSRSRQSQLAPYTSIHHACAKPAVSGHAKFGVRAVGQTECRVQKQAIKGKGKGNYKTFLFSRLRCMLQHPFILGPYTFEVALC